MDETEKAAVRIGRTPFWAMLDDLGGLARGEGWRALSGDDVSQLSRALLDLAEREAATG